MSALPCPRRPARRVCPGTIVVLRSDVPSSIEWVCSSCGDAGVISGWERTVFDLRPTTPNRQVVGSGLVRRVVVAADVAATLRALTLVDVASERLVYGAVATPRGVVLTGTGDDLDDLLEHVAAEANHSTDPRYRKRLDIAYDLLRRT